MLSSRVVCEAVDAATRSLQAALLHVVAQQWQ